MIHSTWPIYSTISCIHTTCTIKESSWKVQTILINLCLLSERKIYILKSIILISFYIISYEKDLCYKLSAYLIMTIVVLHIKYFNLNIIQTWHRITVNISTFFIPFFLKSFLPWRWYDFSLQRYLGSKGKNNFEWSAVSFSLSLSLIHTPLLTAPCLSCVYWSVTNVVSFFFFFNFYQTRRTHFQGETRSQRFFSGMAVVIQDFRLRSTSRLICRISRAIWVIDSKQNAF